MEEIIEDLKNGLTYEDFKQDYNLSTSSARSVLSDLESKGHNIQEEIINDRGKKLFYIEEEEEQYEIEGIPKIAVVSDSHLGSKAEQLESLEKAYDIIEDKDIDLILHGGDISDGCNVYRGQREDKKAEAIGWKRLKDYVLENYPESDIDTFFIDGNHDRRFHSETGIHLGEELEIRDDLNFLGDSYAEIELEDLDIEIQLVHPGRSIPYTLGYRAQTWLRDKPEEAKADLTIFGHLHKLLNAKTEGSEVLYAGAFQGETDFTERKGIKPNCGFWIVEFDQEEDLTSFKTERIEFPLKGREKKVISLNDIPGEE